MTRRTTLEKKFLHEKLKNPQGDEWRVFRAFCDVHNEGKKRIMGNEIALYLDHAPPIMARWKLHEQIGTNLMHTFANDPTMLCLAYMSRFFIRPESKPLAFLFTKEFWPVLRKTKISNISWGMLPSSFTASFRWPEPVFDAEGDPISEMMVLIQPREVIEKIRGRPYTDMDGSGSRILQAWWQCASGGCGFLCQLIPDTNDKIIPDTWNPVGNYRPYVRQPFMLPFQTLKDFHQEPHVLDMLKSLIYVASGDPDLRSERNRIPYKHNSKQPVRAYREYSTQEYQLVGWNWMKKLQERRYTKEGWLVEPFARYQPYGPRDNPSYKWIIVEGHERHRRKGLAEELIQEHRP